MDRTEGNNREKGVMMELNSPSTRSWGVEGRRCGS